MNINIIDQVEEDDIWYDMKKKMMMNHSRSHMLPGNKKNTETTTEKGICNRDYVIILS